MQLLEEPFMLPMLALLVTVLKRLHYMYLRKNVFFNCLAGIYQMILMSSLFSKTTLLIMREVICMVVQLITAKSLAWTHTALGNSLTC